MGIDKVGIDEVGINQFKIPLNQFYLGLRVFHM